MALRTARESIVLLKNQDNFLPLSKDLKTIAVIGPNADSKRVLLGNYNGIRSESVTPLEGIKNALPSSTNILYTKGCKVKRRIFRGFSKALKIAKKADLIVMCLGINQSVEMEDMIFTQYPDRTRIELPPHQEKLLKLIHATGKPIVLVLISGSPIAVPWADENIPAILELWYPGEEGGTALADVFFGDYSPAGRLPVTVYKSTFDLAPITDVRMEGRTYRFIAIDPLYPFGYGLSYTKFKYSNLRLSSDEIKAGNAVEVSVDVENIGDRLGDEVVQLYLKDLEASVRVPHHQLSGFTRVTLKPGEKKTVSFEISARQMALITEEGKCLLEPGQFQIFVGGSQPDNRSKALLGDVVLETNLKVTGSTLELEY